MEGKGRREGRRLEGGRVGGIMVAEKREDREEGRIEGERRRKGG